jgi:hypothetical protein
VSPEGREVVACFLAVALLLIAIDVQRALSRWRARRRILRAFRLELARTTHPGRIDAWTQPSGGREPPPH